MTRSTETGGLGGRLQRWSDAEAARIKNAFLTRSPGELDRPARGWRFAAVMALSTAVLLGYLLVFLTGLWSGWAAWQAADVNGLQVLLYGFLALMCLGFVWIARPLFTASGGTRINAADAPELHRLLSEVAALLGAPMPGVVRVDGQVNASVTREGFPPRFSLTLGLPLVYGLEPQELLCVLAHELAHEINGDPARGQWTWTALRVLHAWRYVATPFGWQMQQNPLTYAVGWVLSLPSHALLWLFVSLGGEEQQQAEFRADLMAAGVAGSAASLGTFDKLHFARLLEFALQKQRSSPERPHAFLELRHAWDSLSPERYGQQRQQNARERLRLDDSHPPTSDRAEVVARHEQGARLLLSRDRAALIYAELAPLVPAIQEEAYEAYTRRYGR